MEKEALLLPKLQLTGRLTGNDYKKIETSSADMWSSAPSNSLTYTDRHRDLQRQEVQGLGRRAATHAKEVEPSELCGSRARPRVFN